jgi:hypothetical protein
MTCPNKHLKLKLQWHFDQIANPEQVWQYKSEGQSDWFSSSLGYEPEWHESSEYRRKPVVEAKTEAQLNSEENSMNTDVKLMLARLAAITAMGKLIETSDNFVALSGIMENPQHKHFSTLARWMADQVADPSQVWQATRKDGTWMDLDQGQEPRFYESREYRRKPDLTEGPAEDLTEDLGLPGAEAQPAWQHDRGNVPPTPWQATRKDGSWMDIGIDTEPRWFESRRYRRKPIIGVSTGNNVETTPNVETVVPLVKEDGMYTYAMIVDSDGRICITTGTADIPGHLAHCQEKNLTVIHGPFMVTVRNGKVIAG